MTRLENKNLMVFFFYSLRPTDRLYFDNNIPLEAAVLLYLQLILYCRSTIAELVIIILRVKIIKRLLLIASNKTTTVYNQNSWSA